MLKELQNEAKLIRKEFEQKFSLNEENKEDQEENRITQQIQNLLNTLLALNQTVIKNVEQMIHSRKKKDTTGHELEITLLKSAIEALQKRIEESDEQSDIENKLLISSDILKIRDQIKSIPYSKAQKSHLKIKFNSKIAEDNLMQLIAIQGIQRMEERFLISPSVTINLAQKKVVKQCSRTILDWSALFQLDQKLYISGGTQPCRFNQTDEVFTIDANQDVQKLIPMIRMKTQHSMTGSGKRIITSGGLYDGTQQFVEQYSLDKGKWSVLPKLCSHKDRHSSCIVNNALFCYFGSNSNSIEKLDLIGFQKFLTIQNKKKFTNSFKPTLAIPLQGQILIFNHVDEGVVAFGSDGKFKHIQKLKLPSLVKPYIYTATSFHLFALGKENIVHRFDGNQWNYL